MGSGHVLSDYAEELTALVREAGPRVVQVGRRHGRPATGTLFGADRVLFAAHAIDRDDGLEVRDTAGTSKPAEYLGADASSGLAVLRASGLGAPFEPAGAAQVGQLVLALGRTASGALAATSGIVSVIGGPLRTGRGPALEQVLRADVRLHPLGAGGPLVDVSGRAVAVATGAMLRGLPLFIPASIAWTIGEAIAKHGRIKRGYLGVSAQPVRLPERQRFGRPQESGLLVIGVAPGSPAERGGVWLGDVILGFDGQPVEDHDALLSLLTGDRVGRASGLDVARGGELHTLQIEVAEREQ